MLSLDYPSSERIEMVHHYFWLQMFLCFCVNFGNGSEIMTTGFERKVAKPVLFNDV